MYFLVANYIGIESPEMVNFSFFDSTTLMPKSKSEKKKQKSNDSAKKVKQKSQKYKLFPRWTNGLYKERILNKKKEDDVRSSER